MKKHPSLFFIPCLDSLRHLTDGSGGVILTRHYDAYGVMQQNSGSGFTRLGYTGELQDPTTSLLYLRARHYNPLLGRFLQRDSYGGLAVRPKSINRYVYVESNPVKYSDPSGHCVFAGIDTAMCIGAAVGAGTGATVAYGTQVYQNYQENGLGWDTFAVRDGDEIIAAAVSGGVGGALAPLALMSGPMGGAVDGAVTGGVNQLVLNWLRECDLTNGLVESMVIGGVTGAAMPIVFSGAKKVLKPLGHKALDLANRVLRDETGAVRIRIPKVLRPGEAGRFADLDSRAIVGDDLTPHHMPQAAAKFTTRDEGGALMMTTAEHELTRTFKSKGRQTLIEDAGLSFRDVLAKDIRDVRSIVGSKYNEGIRDLLEYYRNNFPNLIAK